MNWSSLVNIISFNCFWLGVSHPKVDSPFRIASRTDWNSSNENQRVSVNDSILRALYRIKYELETSWFQKPRDKCDEKFIIIVNIEIVYFQKIVEGLIHRF